MAQLEQCVEHDDAAAREAAAFDFVAHALVHGEANRFVKIALAADERHALHDLGLLRQFLRDAFLRAAKQERLDARGERRAAIRIAVLFNRRAEESREARAFGQQTGHRVREDRPQLFEMVFDRRTGEREALRGMQSRRGERGFRARVFDRLRFIEHGDRPLERGKRFDVAQQQRVGREHERRIADLREAIGAIGAGEREHARVGQKARDLGAPVRRDARRRDDQHRMLQAAGRAFDRDVREHLDRFAQAHIVGEDAARAMFAQRLQPRDAVALIGPQLTHERSGKIDAPVGVRREIVEHRANRRRVVPARRDPACCRERRRLQHRHAHARFLPAAAIAEESAERRQHARNAIDRQRDVAAARHTSDERRLPPRERRGVRIEIETAASERIDQHRQERDARAVDVDAEFEFEPLRGAALVDFRAPFVARLDDAKRKRRKRFDPPAFIAQLRRIAFEKS